MNWIDGVIVLVVLWLTWSAFQAGFIREIVTIMAAVLGVVAAGLLYDDFANDVLQFIDSDRMANIVAFWIIFGAVVLAGQMLASVLKPTVHLLQLGMFDQFAGAAFGFVKAMIFVQVFLILFVTFPKWGLRQDIEESVLGSAIIERTEFLSQLMPDEFGTAVDDFADRI